MARSPIIVGLLVGASLLAPLPASAQTLFGHVLDRLSGQPLPSTSVVLLDSAGKDVRATLSDSTGKFVLDAPRAGRYELYVDRPAYRPLVSDTFNLQKDERWETLLWVTPIPVALGSMSVTVRREDAGLKKLGFYRREKLSVGYLLGPEQVRARRAGETHELLEGIPGLQLAPNPMGRGYLVLSTIGGASGSCPMEIVVDGHRLKQDVSFTLDNMVDAHDVLAVEVYPHGGVGAPIQYAGLDTDCGVVMIWTKERK